MIFLVSTKLNFGGRLYEYSNTAQICKFVYLSLISIFAESIYLEYFEANKLRRKQRALFSWG